MNAFPKDINVNLMYLTMRELEPCQPIALSATIICILHAHPDLLLADFVFILSSIEHIRIV